MPSKKPALMAILIFAILAALPAHAQPNLYQTSLILQQPVQNTIGIDSVVYYWTSFETGGAIGEESLIDFWMELKAGSTAIYVDEVLVDGVVQPLGGQARQLDRDLFWDYDFDIASLIQMRNSAFATIEMSSGEQFHVGDSLDLLSDGVVDIGRYVDGVLSPGGGSETLLIQRTELVLFLDGFESGDLSSWSSQAP